MIHCRLKMVQQRKFQVTIDLRNILKYNVQYIVQLNDQLC